MVVRFDRAKSVKVVANRHNRQKALRDLIDGRDWSSLCDGENFLLKAESSLFYRSKSGRRR
jgi:hypothetical protein